MKVFVTLSLLALLAAAAYLVFFDDPRAIIHQYFDVDHNETADRPIDRLSGFVDSHYDEIFSPLSENDRMMPVQELHEVKATLRDLAATERSEEIRRIYLLGIKVADQMITAISVREKHSRRLANALAGEFDSDLAPPEKREKEANEKREYFVAGIKHAWEREAASMKAEIDKNYDYLRLLER